MGSMGSETNPCELFGLGFPGCDSEILAQVSSEALDGAFVFGESNPCELFGSDFPGCDKEILAQVSHEAYEMSPLSVLSPE